MDIETALAAPLLMRPSLRTRVWGGRAMAETLGREVGESAPVGESWELYHRPEGASRVASGPLGGLGLDELMARCAPALLGRAEPGPEGRFPLLIKWLDARDMLSVQVHPGEEHARREHGDGGKPEAWVVVDAIPGASIIRGFTSQMDAVVLSRAIAAGDMEGVLRRFPVTPGEVVWLPPGTVHAMGEGLLIYEVQWNSDVTYRLYDWGRSGLDGRPRELHLEQALAVIDWEGDGETTHPATSLAPGRELLVSCREFELERLRPAGPFRLGGRDAFSVVTSTRGRVRLGGELELQPGDTALLAAVAGEVSGEPMVRESELLVARPGRESE